MQVPVYNLAGETVEQIEISDGVFDVPFNESVVHQVMVGQRANARQGTASAKTRGEVAGSTKKLFRQKGTGEARAGSMKSPLRKGGGIAFPPMPRSYRQSTPKKVRRLAIKCVLSAKARDKELVVLNGLSFEEPKTARMAEALAALGVDGSALIALPDMETNVIKSARNIAGVRTMPVSLINVVDLLSYKMLVLPVAGVRKIEELWGDKASAGENNASV